MEQKSAEEIKREWAIAEKRQFCKKSCTDISQGLDKLDPRSGNRAIWELLQNARDLAQKNENGTKEAHIKITLTDNEFIFEHQGLPFTHDTFGSLVKQVSSQAKEDEDSVGQYGTGFITTHVFGRKIYVSGSLDMENLAPGKYVNIDNFNIDRTFESIPEFVDKMATQLCNIENLADAPKVNECRQWTKFRYQLETAENAAEKAQNAIDTAVRIMPYVMTINKPIVEVTFCNKNKIGGRTVKFTKEQLADENGLKVMGIHISENGSSSLKKVFYLQSTDELDIVILPLFDAHTAESLTGVAKLFVYFPLLGTEDFGMDFVFHSHRFYPVEERDGLHLPVENANVRNKFETNVRVLNDMSKMLFCYLNNHVNEISNWSAISALNFETIRNKEDITNDFFREFKKSWVNFFEKLPIIPSNSKNVSADSGIYAFNKDITKVLETQTPATFDKVYNAASTAYCLPEKTEVIVWSKILNGWFSDNTFLDYNMLAKGVAEHCGDITHNVLHEFNMFLKNMQQTGLFNTYALIPNREGDFKTRPNVVDASTIPHWLYDMVKGIIPNDTSRFVDENFADIDNFTTFGRNELCTNINDRLVQQRKEYLDKGKSYEKEMLNSIARLSMIFKKQESASIRANVLPLICEHLKIKYIPYVLPPLDSNERDIAQLPFKHLVENLLLEISMKDAAWISNKKEYIYSFHNMIHTWNEYFDRNNPSKEGLAVRYGAFYNMHNVPCATKELKQGINIPDELFELYQSVFDKDLKDTLVDAEYVSFFDFPKIQVKDVAKEIEDFLEEKQYDDDNILDIINHFEDENWRKWFPRIEKNKAELFMKQVKPECKDGVFRLMKINNADTLNQLAELANEDNIEDIIRRGKESLLKDINCTADFEYKKSLGKYVENFIQQELAKLLGTGRSLDTVRVENEQYGHDLVVYHNDNAIYYIEVKSRWNTDQSVMMSPLQLQTSVANKDKYALCCVDMTGISHNDADVHVYPSINETISRIKVLDNIGILNENIVQAIQLIKNDDIHIDGDYRCVIPQKVIDSNKKDFSSLIRHIANIITETNY